MLLEIKMGGASSRVDFLLVNPVMRGDQCSSIVANLESLKLTCLRLGLLSRGAMGQELLLMRCLHFHACL